MTQGNAGSQKRSPRQAGISGFAAVVAVLSLIAVVVIPAAAAPPVQLTYRVTHSVYGNIGSYINTV
jgi:hypothetical protein